MQNKADARTRMEFEAKCKVQKALPKGTSLLAIINVMVKWYSECSEFCQKSAYPQACSLIFAFIYSMQQIVRKHKAYTHVLYHSDIKQLESFFQELTTKLPKLLPLSLQSPVSDPSSSTKYSDEEEFDLTEAESVKLKRVLYPMSLVKRFADIAEENTKNRIETCGILCGAEVNNEYYVKNILIPDQKGNSDSCTTLNYEAILKYVTVHDMIVLGWIHTHPEYDCFLSSIDLHTQYSYQKLLPEAVAIVYSGLPITPSEKVKAFRVKDEFMEEIGRCGKSGFHEHSAPPRFMGEECSHIGLYDPFKLKFMPRIDDFRTSV